MIFDPFNKYKNEKDNQIINKVLIWKTAIGLQDVDNLKVSSYLYKLANLHINNEINIDLAIDLLNEYHSKESNLKRDNEADIVTCNIVKYLLDSDFSLSVEEYVKTNRELFNNLYTYAGKIRTTDIRKRENICNGHSVYYGDCKSLKEDLNEAFNLENSFDYLNLTDEEKINHLANFIKTIWKLHPFGEGNTRTTACFLIKYLNKLGYLSLNDTFYKNSKYFRNALVRATFREQTDISYLVLFLRSLILKENNKFNNKNLYIK